jgi:hypothetical protein
VTLSKSCRLGLSFHICEVETVLARDTLRTHTKPRLRAPCGLSSMTSHLTPPWSLPSLACWFQPHRSHDPKVHDPVYCAQWHIPRGPDRPGTQ